MGDVIDVSKYVRTDVPSANTPILAAAQEWSRRDDFTGGGPTLGAATVLRLNSETDLSRFLGLAVAGIAQMERVEERLAANDFIGADDEFLASKKTLTELLMYRDISDALGLIVLKCFQAAASVHAITGAKSMPAVIKRALQRIWSAPFMKFETACEIADQIDTLGPFVLPGYTELAAELLGDAAVPEMLR
jgi:hypothetical protein